MKNPLDLVNNTILIIYFALAVATPLIFTTATTELYEVPKMFFVYFCAVILFSLTLLKITITKKLEIPRSKSLLALIAFTFVILISTITSTDRYLSTFGYPTRLNGGLLSQIAYLVIFIAALINLSREKARSVLLALVIGATAVSIWGIPSHFGLDPTCFVLTNELTSACWQKEFNPILRIFSTLGQPNWLASYLVLILPFSIAFSIFFKNQKHRIFFGVCSVLIFWALILTNSRSGFLGLGASLIVLFILLGIKTVKENLKIITALTIIFLVLSLFFLAPLTSRLKDAFQNSKVDPISATQSSSPNIASSAGPTESGQIRLIVWRGALDVFSHWPIFGSGPETFVNTYYLYRPIEHNQTTEWEFFYNKAHNEFVNYLANTGFFGIFSFLAFLLFAFLELLQVAKLKENVSILTKAAIAGASGYLVTIFFGFSTVATQTVFFLITASIILFNSKQQKIKINFKFLENANFKKISFFTVFFLGLFSLVFILRLTIANILENNAQSSQNFAKQTRTYKNALTTSPAKNPYLMTNFAFDLASYLEKEENQQNKNLIAKEVVAQIENAISESPNNYLVLQRAVKTYVLLINADQKYSQQGINLGTKLTSLAPTYPISYLTLAKIQIATDNLSDAQKNIEKVLTQKPDYLEAKELLDQITAKPLQ